MKIGELAGLSGTSVRMLRFYENMGILSPKRTSGGYREYGLEDIGFVKKVMLLNHAGLPLKDIALLRDCLRDEPQNFCSELRGRLIDTQSDIDRQIRALRESKALIGSLLEQEKQV